MEDFGLYLIISSPVLSYEVIAEICVKNRVKMLQLREKELNDRMILQVSSKIQKITRKTETSFIMNDRIDLALAGECDGIHLGQDDLPIETARKINRKDLIYGLSTHSIEQVKEAIKKKPDYIGFGPIYKTPTKKIPDPVVGVENLEKVVDFSPVPVVAIGGIDEDNILDVLKTGVKNICMVRYFMKYENLEYRINKIKEIMNKFK